MFNNLRVIHPRNAKKQKSNQFQYNYIQNILSNKRIQSITNVQPFVIYVMSIIKAPSGKAFK